MSRTYWLQAALATMLVAMLAGADWPQFRGPASNGFADAKNLPTAFSDDEQLVWKVKLPGPGASSPIVVGDRILVTSYGGYGVNATSPGDERDLVRYLACYNKADGKELWKQQLDTDTSEARYSGMMTQHGYASNTPASDGKNVFVFLGTGGVWAFDLEGKKLWQASVGSGTDGWGSASSIVLADEFVIVNAAIESKAIVALSKQNGAEVWRFAVSGRSWATPAIVKSPEGKPELVVSVEKRISGLDIATGKELWHCDGIQDYTCPSVTAGDGVAYISGGRRSSIMAVKTGGSGDVTDTHLLWTKVIGGNVTTPALVGDTLYGVSDRSIAYALNAKTGDTIYETRLASTGGAAAPPAAETPRGERPERPSADGNPPRTGGGRPGFGGRPGGGFGGGFGGGRGGGSGLYASVVAADGKLFAVTRTGGVYVLAADKEYKVLAHNQFASDKSRFDATPTVADNRLYLRSEEALYCIGDK